MGKSPEELKLRGEIAHTRENLSDTLDAIEDRVVPSRIVERRKEQFRSRLSEFKDTVMGSADDLRQSGADKGGQLSDRVSDATEWAQQAPGSARSQAQGNPLAAGLIAFGAGLLAAAIFPGTKTEGQAAQKLQEVTQPLAEQVKQAGTEVVSNLQAPALDAAQHVKDTATAGVTEVKDTAMHATEDTKQAAAEATSQISDQAQQSADNVRQQT